MRAATPARVGRIISGLPVCYWKDHTHKVCNLPTDAIKGHDHYCDLVDEPCENIGDCEDGLSCEATLPANHSYHDYCDGISTTKNCTHCGKAQGMHVPIVQKTALAKAIEEIELRFGKGSDNIRKIATSINDMTDLFCDKDGPLVTTYTPVEDRVEHTPVYLPYTIYFDGAKFYIASMCPIHRLIAKHSGPISTSKKALAHLIKGDWPRDYMHDFSGD